MKFLQEKRERTQVWKWLADRGIKSTVSHEGGWLMVTLHKRRKQLKPEHVERLTKELLEFTGRSDVKPDGRITIT